MHIKKEASGCTHIGINIRLLALMEVLHNSCNMGTRDLPEMYACRPRLCPQTLGIHFRRITHAHVTTIN